MNKKTITFFLLLSLAILTPLFGKDKIKKLTPAEIIAVDSFIETLPDPNIVRDIEKEKGFKHTNVRNLSQMDGLKTWASKVKAGKIKCKKRIDGEYVINYLERTVS